MKETLFGVVTRPTSSILILIVEPTPINKSPATLPLKTVSFATEPFIKLLLPDAIPKNPLVVAQSLASLFNLICGVDAFKTFKNPAELAAVDGSTLIPVNCEPSP